MNSSCGHQPCYATFSLPTNKKEHSLKSRYQEFKYVLQLVCDEMGHSYKGKDCTCGECNNLFEPNVRRQNSWWPDGLNLKWGPKVNQKDFQKYLLQDIIVGQYFDSNHLKKQHRYVNGRQVCYSFFLAAPIVWWSISNCAISTPGIKWVKVSPPNDAIPLRVSFTDALKADHWKDSQSMFAHIISKCQPMNSTIFTGSGGQLEGAVG